MTPLVAHNLAEVLAEAARLGVGRAQLLLLLAHMVCIYLKMQRFEDKYTKNRIDGRIFRT